MTQAHKELFEKYQLQMEKVTRLNQEKQNSEEILNKRITDLTEEKNAMQVKLNNQSAEHKQLRTEADDLRALTSKQLVALEEKKAEVSKVTSQFDAMQHDMFEVLNKHRRS